MTEFKSDAHYATLRATRSIARDRILALPYSVPVVLTDAHASDSDAKRKPRDPDMFKGNTVGRPLLDRGGDDLLRFDSTHTRRV